eukprot:4239630-Ditylum_brightwellii.AAC.1
MDMTKSSNAWFHKKAICRVYQPLGDTFIGKEESNRIQQRYITAQFTETMPLYKLDKRIVSPPPSTPLLYDASTKETKGVGYNIAYSIRSRTSFDMDYDRPTVLEIFAGAGGMTTGFTQGGFDVKWAVENDSAAAANLKINKPNVEVFDEDVH